MKAQKRKVTTNTVKIDKPLDSNTLLAVSQEGYVCVLVVPVATRSRDEIFNQLVDILDGNEPQIAAVMELIENEFPLVLTTTKYKVDTHI